MINEHMLEALAAAERYTSWWAYEKERRYGGDRRKASYQEPQPGDRRVIDRRLEE